VVRVSDVENEIRVHGFDPDGFIESAVLELDGVPVATNGSGNISFWQVLPESGEHELRLIVTDATGLTASRAVTFSTASTGVPGEVTAARDNDDVVIQYDGLSLEASTDLEQWIEVHIGGGEYRISAPDGFRFFRSTH
jgi:hypothetical protein